MQRGAWVRRAKHAGLEGVCERSVRGCGCVRALASGVVSSPEVAPAQTPAVVCRANCDVAEDMSSLSSSATVTVSNLWYTP